MDIYPMISRREIGTQTPLGTGSYKTLRHYANQPTSFKTSCNFREGSFEALVGGIRYLVKAADGGGGNIASAYDGWELNMATCSCIVYSCAVSSSPVQI